MAGRITIVGLGPGDPSLRTVGAKAALDSAKAIILRTGIHPGIKDLLADSRVSTCDELYQSRPAFEEVYEAIAERVIEASAHADIVFAVPGHPFFGERTVQRIIDIAAEQNLEVDVQSAVSALDVIASATAIDPFSDELQIIDAETLDSIWKQEPFSGGWLAIDPTRPVLIAQVYSQLIASHVKLSIARFYPEDHLVQLIKASSVPGDEEIIDCFLYEIDHQSVDHLTSLLIPPLGEHETFRTAQAVQRLVAHLRSPEGCPWDRKQTHETLRDALIEEAHEVVDAIEEGDFDHLAEELGDLFLLIAMHAQIADEAGTFSLEGVYEHISKKLIRRHPHVFGDAEAITPDDVVATWEGVKRVEREQAGRTTVEQEVHSLDRLPKSMPALARVTSVMRSGLRGHASESSGNDHLAADLYDAVEALVAAGLDPEQELLRIARDRTDAKAAGSVPHFVAHETQKT